MLISTPSLKLVGCWQTIAEWSLETMPSFCATSWDYRVFSNWQTSSCQSYPICSLAMTAQWDARDRKAEARSHSHTRTDDWSHPIGCCWLLQTDRFYCFRATIFWDLAVPWTFCCRSLAGCSFFNSRICNLSNPANVPGSMISIWLSLKRSSFFSAATILFWLFLSTRV